MGKHIKYNQLFGIERVDEHIIRPELIAQARERLFQAATNQLIMCDRGVCGGGLGACDNSCLEAKSFITGKVIPEIEDKYREDENT